MSEASIMAIDPGTDESAYVIWNGVTLWDAAIVPNHVLIDRMNNIVPVYCEMIARYGMRVGREVFETCLWIGEFRRVCKDIVTPFTQVFRREVKLHHCNAVQAKDCLLYTSPSPRDS